MTGGHRALIVEDDRPTADDLAEILTSLGCDCSIATNKRDALSALAGDAYCLILLDLEIKLEPASIRGHTEHGNSLLREIRQLHSEHTGLGFWLPILIVSGFAREVGAAVEVMKDGANDVIHKPFVGWEVSDTVRRALERSGRATHALCAAGPVARALDAKATPLSIPGDRVGRRTRVRFGSRSTLLTDSSLKVLLHLMVARAARTAVHKKELGARRDQGFKGISVLRDALKPALGEGIDIIGNDRHGGYYLTDDVTIGICDAEKLASIGDRKITELARELRRTLDASQ
jgi:DNA-binding response OmpR family regulator